MSIRKLNNIYLYILNGQKYIILPAIDWEIVSGKISQTVQKAKIEKLKDKNIFYVSCDYENGKAVSLNW